MLKLNAIKHKVKSSFYKEKREKITCGHMRMTSKIGTKAFAAPEVYSGFPYNEKVDSWSAGTILYFMLSGCLPFEAEDNETLREKVN